MIMEKFNLKITHLRMTFLFAFLVASCSEDDDFMQEDDMPQMATRDDGMMKPELIVEVLANPLK